MIIEQTDELSHWMLDILPGITDADPKVLIQFFFAVCRKDKPLEEHRDVAQRELDVFLGEETKKFIDDLFARINEQQGVKKPKAGPPSGDERRDDRRPREERTRPRNDSRGEGRGESRRRYDRDDEGDDRRRGRRHSPRISYKRGFEEDGRQHSDDDSGRRKRNRGDGRDDRRDHMDVPSPLRGDAAPTERPNRQQDTSSSYSAPPPMQQQQPQQQQQQGNFMGGPGPMMGGNMGPPPMGMQGGPMNQMGGGYGLGPGMMGGPMGQHMGMGGNMMGMGGMGPPMGGVRQRCPDYENKGICLMGDDCQYEHVNPQVLPIDSFNGPVAPFSGPPMHGPPPPRPSHGQPFPGPNGPPGFGPPPPDMNFRGGRGGGRFRGRFERDDGPRWRGDLRDTIGGPPPRGDFGGVRDLREILGNRRGPEMPPDDDEYQPEDPGLTQARAPHRPSLDGPPPRHQPPPHPSHGPPPRPMGPPDGNFGGPRPPRPTGTGRSTELEISGLQPGQNVVGVLSDYFSKFGTVINVTIHLNGRPDMARVQFSNNLEAEAAHRDPEAILGNRFIKAFFPRRNAPPHPGAHPAARDGARPPRHPGQRGYPPGGPRPRPPHHQQQQQQQQQKTQEEGAGVDDAKPKAEMEEWQKQYVDRFKQQQAEIARQKVEQKKALLEQMKKAAETKEALIRDQKGIFEKLSQGKGTLSKEERLELMKQFNEIESQIKAISINAAPPQQQQQRPAAPAPRPPAPKPAPTIPAATANPPENSARKASVGALSSKIYVSGLSGDVIEPATAHFAQFGPLSTEGITVHGKGVIVAYAAAESAKKALEQGGTFEGKTWPMVWFLPPQKKAVPTTNGTSTTSAPAPTATETTATQQEPQQQSENTTETKKEEENVQAGGDGGEGVVEGEEGAGEEVLDEYLDYEGDLGDYDYGDETYGEEQ